MGGLSACWPVSAATPTPWPSPTPPPPSATATVTPVWFPPTATFTPFPSAAPATATPEQRPGRGALLLEDDFTNAELWTSNATAAGRAAVNENLLTLAISQPKGYLFSLRTEPLLTDFYLEISASPSLCREADEYGLLLRAAPTPAYYRFGVSCAGQVRLDRITPGGASSPQPWVAGLSTPPGAPSTARLGAWVVGAELRLFVNDQYQFSVRDPALSSGLVGVYARAAGSSPVTVSFSDLKIWEVIR